ncbi:MAG: hypothetical protein M3025_03960 [Actinomycetota bacterium]|jgi:hypothetical protein|nr:hypothetical protein [Actinomycetota bacterium]
MSTAFIINLGLAVVAVATIFTLIAFSIATQHLDRGVTVATRRSRRWAPERTWRQIGAGRVQVWPAS